MYWSRTGSIASIILWLLITALWWAGGWLIVRHLFRIRVSERPITGLASGLLLFITLSNLLANFLPLSPALWGGALLVLGIGAYAAWRYPGRKIGPADIRAWPQLLSFGLLLLVFVLINRGLAIFDDYNNLPLTSVIAAGDLPPHFYLDPTRPLGYHYGLHIFAATLARIGDFFPWSAFDFGRAFGIALAVHLAWLWLRRVTHSTAAAYLGALAVLFVGGSRWIFLLLPESWLVHLSSNLQMMGSAAQSGPDLAAALVRPWNIEGGGPMPFPFAYSNGIFSPLVLALTGSGALPQATIFVLLLLFRRRWPALAGLVYGLILASLALTAEYLLVTIWAGAGLLLLFRLGRRFRATFSRWAWILAPGLLLGLFAGGVLTELARGLILPEAGSSGAGVFGFGLRWPPAIVSSHLGVLSIFNPWQLLAAFIEMGPVLILGLVVVMLAWQAIYRGRDLYAVLGLAALISFLIPIFVRYDVERDISRFSGLALFTWLALGLPWTHALIRQSGAWARYLVAAGGLIASLAGIVLFGVELIAAPLPRFTYFVEVPDALVARQYWDRLPEGAYVFDPAPVRAVTLFGRPAGRAQRDYYEFLPEFAALRENPDPQDLAAAGYSYLYFDKGWWQDLTIPQKEALEQDCVSSVDEQTTDEKDFRRLLDLRGCLAGQE